MFGEKVRTQLKAGSRRLSSQRWLLVGLSLAGILLALALFLGWVPRPWLKADDQSDVKKNTVRVTRGSIDLRISATGTVRPLNQVKISPKLTGLLKKLLVQQGDYVKRGQIIAIMDDSNLIGQVASARGAYEMAQASYQKALAGNRPQEISQSAAQVERYENSVRNAELAVAKAKSHRQSVLAQLLRDETNARRLTDLARQGAISDQERLNAVTQAQMTKSLLDQAEQELHQSEAALAQSQAELKSSQSMYSLMRSGFRKEDIQSAYHAMQQAKGNLQFLQSQLNDTRIRAPFAGVVTQKYTDEGAIVTPTTSAATLSATSSSIVSLAGDLEVVAQVGENDIESIERGQAVEIVPNSYHQKTFKGHVRLVAPEAIVTQNVTTFEVHVTIENDKEHELMSGMNVNCNFIAGRKDNVLLVPVTCIISKLGRTGVLVPDKDGTPEFRSVMTGATSGTMTVVTEGLKEGDLVYIGLTKAQLEEHGYIDRTKLPGMGGSGGSSQPPIPRGFARMK